MIVTCNCKNEYQDKKYGQGKRVMNECNSGCRCTVCGTVRSKSVPLKEKEKI